MHEERTTMSEDMRSPPTLSNKPHILFLPFPAQGHINPSLQFAKRLASKGLNTTLVTTVYVSKTMYLNPNCKVGIETISDGFDHTGLSAANGHIYVTTFKQVGSQTLANVIKKYISGEHNPISCIVCDSILPWALDVGKQFGLVTAILYTQPCGVSTIFYHIKKGNLTVPVDEPTVSLPGLPLLAQQDLPSSVLAQEPLALSPSSVPVEKPVALKLLVDQFSNLEKADWLLFNTFEQLESEALESMRKLLPVRTIGPTTPSMYLDKRVDGDTENSLNIFKPSENSYIKWLDGKEAGSVLYIAFGSLAQLNDEQMEELIWGIKNSSRDFIWVLREHEQSKLPKDFVVELSAKSLLVSWCSQLEVLAHEAIGCFLTHCGWNSVTEAFSLGVPMVAMPQIWDQTTNAKFIEDVWGLGIRPKKDDKGIVRRDEIETSIRDVMDGERGKVIKANATRWRELAKVAVDVGGSSDLHIEEFVASIPCTVNVITV